MSFKGKWYLEVTILVLVCLSLLSHHCIYAYSVYKDKRCNLKKKTKKTPLNHEFILIFISNLNL